jgi:GT2 family glycosyltransferase/2-polyprenyl-3-methyl-5-hydroxy-6-metoxy-1,4-benzoquinol methylase
MMGETGSRRRAERTVAEPPIDGDMFRYEAEIDLANADSSQTQLVLLTSENRQVLDVGCATGSVAQALTERGCRVVGIEIDPIAAKQAERFCDEVIVGDVEALDLADSLGTRRFDVILLGDVLEHLRDPGRVLRALAGFLAPGGYVVASIPNITHASIRLALLTGRFRYTDEGILDRTHLRFFDRAGVQELFVNAGYHIELWRQILVDLFDTQQELDREAFPPSLVDAVRAAPDGLTFQFLVVARPTGATRTLAVPQDDGGLSKAEPRETNVVDPLMRLEQHVRNLEDLTRKREDSIRELQRQVQEVVSAKDTELAKRDDELERRSLEIDDLRAWNDRLQQSFGHRFTVWLDRLVNRVGPWGTRRRGLVLTLGRLMKSLVVDGIRPFLRRLVRVQDWVPDLFRRAYPNPDRLTAGQRYTLWLELCVLSPKRMRAARRHIRRLRYCPTISIVMPVHDVRPEWLRAAFISVLGQVYEGWELCVVDDASRNPRTLEVLRQFEGTDKRIKIRYLQEQRGIAGASNEGLEMATGEFVGFLDHDDELKKNALYEVVKALNQQSDLDFIYSDEDKRETDGQLCDPFFKPDWSPDLLMSVNYVTHLAVYRRSIVERVGRFREGFDGSQDYDLILRVSELTDRIGHVTVPLYTWRKVPGSAAAAVKAKAYALDAAKRALTEALRRRGYEGAVEDALVEGRYRARYAIRGEPSVLIIVPTRDKLEMLRRCIESVRKRTTYKPYELMIVDNESRDPETLKYLSSFDGRVLPYPHPFNYARMMNLAVSEAGDAELVLFLNNDTEVISEEWLEAMVEHAQRPDVAGVGARLLYPDGSPQHEGIIIGFAGGSAGNVNFGGFDGMGETIRNCSAVTGACMLFRREVYDELGGLEEGLGVAFNDVDFCLRAREKGYEIVYTPYAALYHHESASRGTLHPDEDERFFRARWGDPGDYRDPYYNPNLDPLVSFQLRKDIGNCS